MVRFLEQYPDISVDLVLDARSLNLEEEGFDECVEAGVGLGIEDDGLGEQAVFEGVLGGFAFSFRSGRPVG